MRNITADCEESEYREKGRRKKITISTKKITRKLNEQKILFKDNSKYFISAFIIGERKDYGK